MSGYTPITLEKCEDCGTICTLIKMSACADECCFKFICQDGCQYYCSSGHENISQTYDGEHDLDKCLICNEEMKPKYSWYGISIASLEDRRDNW